MKAVIFAATTALAAVASGYVIQVPSLAAPSNPVASIDYDDGDLAAAYRYLYTVADSLSGASFNVGEERDGALTSGAYSVALPDGRIQTVNYRVTPESGYVADVTYTGEAHYPVEAPPPPPAPAPVKKPTVSAPLTAGNNSQLFVWY
jgi:hypothetical protein